MGSCCCCRCCSCDDEDGDDEECCDDDGDDDDDGAPVPVMTTRAALFHGYCWLRGDAVSVTIVAVSCFCHTPRSSCFCRGVFSPGCDSCKFEACTAAFSTWQDVASATTAGHACQAQDPDHAERALASELQCHEARRQQILTLLPLSFSLLLEKEAQNMQGTLTLLLAMNAVGQAHNK